MIYEHPYMEYYAAVIKNEDLYVYMWSDSQVCQGSPRPPLGLVIH